MTWWHALRGFTKWAAAIASGDVRPDEEQRRVANACGTCPALTAWEVDSAGEPDTIGAIERAGLAVMGVHGRAGFCGTPISPHRGRDGDPERPEETSPENTCGCLVLAETTPGLAHVTVRGVPLRAAGKAEVGSETCARWRAESAARTKGGSAGSGGGGGGDYSGTGILSKGADGVEA